MSMPRWLGADGCGRCLRASQPGERVARPQDHSQHFLGYTIEDKSLPEKEKIILASCGEVGFRCPAPKRHLISENSRHRESAALIRNSSLPPVCWIPEGSRLGGRQFAGSSRFGVDARCVTPQKEEASKEQM